MSSSFRKDKPIKEIPRYSDISMNFSKHPTNRDLVRVSNFDAVKLSVRNLIQTNPYERLLNPRIGSGIRGLLFEPMLPSTTIALRDAIEETIKNHEKRAILNNVVVEPDYDLQSYYVKIIFSMAYSNEQAATEFFLERIR